MINGRRQDVHRTPSNVCSRRDGVCRPANCPTLHGGKTDHLLIGVSRVRPPGRPAGRWVRAQHPAAGLCLSGLQEDSHQDSAGGLRGLSALAGECPLGRREFRAFASVESNGRRGTREGAHTSWTRKRERDPKAGAQFGRRCGDFRWLAAAAAGQYSFAFARQGSACNTA